MIIKIHFFDLQAKKVLYFLFFLRFSSDTNLNIMNNIYYIYTITNPLRMTWRRNYDRKLISIR